MNGSYVYKKYGVFDFLQSFDELREYLKPELKNAEMILIVRYKASALRISDVRSALEIAENVEEFLEMVKVNVESGINETRLPFDDDEYFDIHTHDEYFSPDTNFYFTNTKLRNYRAKTDYEAVSKNPRPTTPGLGTGRATARNRTNFAQTSFPISNKYPGGNIRKLSFKDLRKLISQENKR